MNVFTTKISLLILILIIFSNVKLVSQDIIVLTDNTTVVAKNIVVRVNDVEYQNFNDSSKVIIPRNSVQLISYNDGSQIELNSIQKSFNRLDLGNNLVSFHFLDFVISNFTLSYERIISDGKYGIQIPVSIGYKDKPSTIYFPLPMEPDYTNKLVSKFYTGINFNIYPTGQARFKYYLGPGLRFGNGLFFENANNYSSNSQQSIKTGYFKFLLNNGVVYTPVNSLSISIIGSIGIQYMFDKQINKAQTSGALSINLSLRF